MKKDLSINQKEELEQIKLFCNLSITFMLSIATEKTILEMFRNVVEDEYNKKNLKGLKYMFKDVKEWIGGLSDSDISDLSEILEKENVKYLIDNDEKNNNKVIENVLRKKKIDTKNEYKIILNRVEEIHLNNEKKVELEELNLYLSQFL